MSNASWSWVAVFAAMSFGGLIAVLMFVVGVLSWEFCCALAMRSAHVVFVVCVGNVQCVCEFGRSCVCHCRSLVQVFFFVVRFVRFFVLEDVKLIWLQSLFGVCVAKRHSQSVCFEFVLQALIRCQSFFCCQSIFKHWLLLHAFAFCCAHNATAHVSLCACAWAIEHEDCFFCVCMLG